MKTGVQLYGLDHLCKSNAKDLFEALSSFGYRLIEPCFVPDIACGAQKGWGTDEIPEIINLANEKNLEIISCHILCRDYRKNLSKMIEIARTYQIQQIVWNIPYPKNYETISDFVSLCLEAVREMEPFGISLLLHNGPDDIREQLDHMSVYEWILKKCEGKVYAQPDVGWILRGGDDPERFLWKNEKYIKSLHYKDFKKNTDAGGFNECAIGEGILDPEPVFQFGRYQEIPHFMDQDSSEDDILQDMRKNQELLRRLSQSRSNTKSTLCVMDIETKEITEIQRFDRVIEAPNWTKDGSCFYYNSEGKIYRYDISELKEMLIETGECRMCNNDHVLSPDETQIAISNFPDMNFISQIYTVPAIGGIPQQVTIKGPSYLHGWSPDGKEMAYCAFRENSPKGDVYTITIDSREEKQLTADSGLNDGPEYSPDGSIIWFNSTRSGLMQIWKMNRDGSNPTQMTFENQNNWFAHISPDGKKIVNIAYHKDALDPDEHLPNMKVELWLMDSDGSNREKLLEFFGGQGSINVNSWAYDSRRFAFIKYELIHK